MLNVAVNTCFIQIQHSLLFRQTCIVRVSGFGTSTQAIQVVEFSFLSQPVRDSLTGLELQTVSTEWSIFVIDRHGNAALRVRRTPTPSGKSQRTKNTLYTGGLGLLSCGSDHCWLVSMTTLRF